MGWMAGWRVMKLKPEAGTQAFIHKFTCLSAVPAAFAI